jgi:PKD repeat protein
MKVNFFYTVLSLALFFSLMINGQTLKQVPSNDGTPFNSKFCGTDSIHNEKMKSDPDYKKRHEEMLESIGMAASIQRRLPNGVLQVPVVVHVMHKGEPLGSGTNISDTDVKLGLKYLNNYWRSISGTYGDGEGVDMNIEFVLAIQDENGNATDGISRVDMSGVVSYVNGGVGDGGLPDYDSGEGVNSLKEYSNWDPTKYYNVWLVDEIDNSNCYSGGSYTAGYAYYSSSHGAPWDGSVVLICTYLEESSYTWAHEMGHALNLQHTFNGDDPDTNTCGDDGITDTPEHIRTSAITPSIYWDCETTVNNNCDPAFNQVINPETGFSRNSGTHQDHMFNYMDYSSCSSEFTAGQRDEAINALLAGRGSRNSYFEGAALEPVAAAVIDFDSPSIICLGNETTFTDKSANTPNSYTNEGYEGYTFAWTFDDGQNAPITSTLQNPTITFQNAGTYDLTFEITNSKGTSSLTKQDALTIVSSLTNVCTPTNDRSPTNIGAGVTKVTFNTLENLTNTNTANNPVQDFRCSKSTIINSGISYDLVVEYTSVSSNAHYVEAWIDWDGSGTFDLSNTNNINELVLSENTPTETPGFNTASVSITAPTEVNLNTVFTLRVISSSNQPPNVCGGSRFTQRADDYSVLVRPASNLNIDQIAGLNLALYPNPVQDELTIALQNKAALNAYAIYDISGKKVMASTINPSNRIQVSGLSKGLYFIKVKAANSEMIGKFIKN